MTIKSREFDHIISKLEFEVRNSKDLLAWFIVDGKMVARTKRSKKRGDLPMQHSIRQQLHLNENQLRQAAGCSLSRDDYIAILRAKKLL